MHPVPRPARTVPAAATAVVLLAGLLLAGCASGGPTPTGTTTSAPGATTTPSPGATPSPTPTATPTPAPTSTPGAGGPSPTAPAPGGPVTVGTTTITAPTPGSTVPGPAVQITGTATAFEATCTWRVLVAGTDEVAAEDWTPCGANGEIGPFTVDVELEPGDWTVEVFPPDMSDGEGAAQVAANLASVTFTVT